MSAKKIMTALTSFMLVFSTMSVPIHADDVTASSAPDASSTASASDTGGTTTAGQSDVVVETPSDSSSDFTVTETENKSDNSNTDDKSSETVEDAYAEKINKHISDEAKDRPHINVYVTGNGSLDLKAPDGSEAKYTALESELVSNPNNASDPEAYVPQDSVLSYTIYGNEGDRFAVTPLPDDGQSVTQFETMTAYTSGYFNPNDFMLDKDKNVLDTREITLKAGEMQELYVQFTYADPDDCLNKTMDKLQELYPDSAAGTSGSVFVNQKLNVNSSVSNSLRTSALISSYSPIHKGEVMSDNGSCTITISNGRYYFNGSFSGGKDQFNPYYYGAWTASSPTGTSSDRLAAHLSKVGGSVQVLCGQPGPYAPQGGKYTCNWQAFTDAAANTVRISITVITGSSSWGGAFGTTQILYGGFSYSSPKTYKPHISFHKKSRDTALFNEFNGKGMSLAGAEYAMYADSNRQQLLTRFTTDANGNADVHVDTSISNNVVYIVETKAPQGFELNSDMITVNLDDSGFANVEQDETPQTSTLGIRKIDQNGNDVAGASLAMYDENGTEVHRWISNGGVEELPGVKPGRYKVRELIPPKGFFPAEDQWVTLTPGQTSAAVMKDESIGDFEVLKVDEAGNPVSGCVLGLYGRDNSDPNAAPGAYGPLRLLESWTTGTTAHKLGTGELHGGWDGAYTAGTGYYIKEISVPDGYELSDDIVGFQIPAREGSGGTVTLKFGNKSIKYEVEKYDALSKAPLKGATLQLLDANGNVKEEWVTDGTPHKLNPKNLHYGSTYYIHEAKAPAGYYYMSDDVKFTVFHTGGEYTTVTGYDYPIQLYAEKIDAESKERIGNVNLTLCDDSGKEIYSWVTSADKAEEIPSEKLEPGMTYHLKETGTPDGYYPTTKETTFKIAKTSASFKTQHPIYIKITNKHITVKVGKYSLEKDENGKTINKLIPGATLAVGTKDKSGKFTPIVENIISTDSLQTLDYHLFKAGETYYLREIKAPDNYYYMLPGKDGSNDVAFTIPATQQEMEQNPATQDGVQVRGLDYPIQFEVMKTDDNSKPLSGVHFALCDKNNKTLEDWYSDTAAHLITSKLTAGETYTIKELSPVSGFYPVTETKFEVPKYPAEKDRDAVIKLKPLRKTIVNDHINMKLLKVDENDDFFTVSDDGSCAKFEIYDTKGTPNDVSDDGDPIYTADELSTDNKDYEVKQGFDIGSKLYAGVTYRVHEAVCPNGYDQAPDQTFTVPATAPEDSGKAITIKVKDNALQVKFTKITRDADGKETTLYSYTDGFKQTHPFKFEVVDEETKKTMFTFSTDDKQYKKNGYIDIGSKLEFGKTYRVIETEYPDGYYRARDGLFTVEKANTVYTVKMSDPPIHAKFRKNNIKGDALTDQGFKFQVVDTATNKSVALLSMDKDNVDEYGFVHFGDKLKEGHTYKIVEFEWPAKYKAAAPVQFTVPTYYQQD